MDYQANGATVHTERYGSGEKKIVLLHGWGCSTELMKPVADKLCDGAEVLLVDFPGHGASSRPPEPWGVPEYAACLKEVLRQADFLPCDAVAHSFGARVAILLASEDPAMFRRLILTGAAGIRKQPTEADKKRTAQYKKLRGAAETLRRMKIFGSLPDQLEDKLRRKYGSADYNALDEEMRKTFVKVVNLDLSDRLSRITAPTLLIFGTEDTATPVWMGEKMAAEIPDAALIRLEGGTHFAYLEQLPRFAAIAHNFLLEG